ncbi:MAG TPA: DUF3761 domain-containing protein [Candidatus Dormibacteraeota bacterium]
MADSCASTPTTTNTSAAASDTSTSTPTDVFSSAPAAAPTSAPTQAPAAVAPPVTSGFDHNAAQAAGASAICNDGTWSYSAHRSGTCSHHGGVNWWTGNLGPPGPG